MYTALSILRKILKIFEQAASIAGNLMLKHAHPEFPSDAFIVLATVGTKINIMSTRGLKQQVDFDQFWQTDMRSQIIVSLTLPPLSRDHVIRTFKIMPRSSHAHAYINAGFCAQIDQNDSKRVLQKPTIIFGGINPSFVSSTQLSFILKYLIHYFYEIQSHATKTEEFLTGKAVGDQKVLQGAVEVLERELAPNEDPLEPSIQYRKTVAQGLLYKV